MNEKYKKGAEFLKDRFWSNSEFREAIKRGEGEAQPEDLEEFLERLSKAIQKHPEMFKEMVKKITINPEDKEGYITKDFDEEYIKNLFLSSFAERKGYQRHQVKDNLEIIKTLFEQEYGQSFEDFQITEEQKREELERIQRNQTDQIDQWLNYLTTSEAENYPIHLRYWVFAEMLKLGNYNPSTGRFSKRTEATIASFPPLNQQALAKTFDYAQADGGSANFKRLYEKALKEVDELKSPENLEKSTEYEWREYPIGSDPQRVVDDLKEYNTHWCIAHKGTAEGYLKHSKLYICFSKEPGVSDGTFQPRACIVSHPDQGITEVRGVLNTENTQQHLDDYITEEVSKKLETIEGGQKWEEAMEDMGNLSRIHTEVQNGIFDDKTNEEKRKDLRFIYQIDKTIQNTGYGEEDPRIQEILEGRDKEEDMLTIFECTKYQIANTPNEINEKTKVYVGQLEPGIFQKFPEDLEYIYTSFPERKIHRETIEIGGKTAEELIQELEESNMNISQRTESMLLNKEEFIHTENREEITLIRLTVRDLGFNTSATTDQIERRAKELGLELCPPDTGPNYRLQYKDQPLNEWVRVGMKPIHDSVDDPDVFDLGRIDDGLWLNGSWANPDDEGDPDDQFVFRFRKSES
jgi:hypothetical protein